MILKLNLIINRETDDSEIEFHDDDRFLIAFQSNSNNFHCWGKRMVGWTTWRKGQLEDWRTQNGKTNSTKTLPNPDLFNLNTKWQLAPGWGQVRTQSITPTTKPQRPSAPTYNVLPKLQDWERNVSQSNVFLRKSCRTKFVLVYRTRPNCCELRPQHFRQTWQVQRVNVQLFNIFFQVPVSTIHSNEFEELGSVLDGTRIDCEFLWMVASGLPTPFFSGPLIADSDFAAATSWQSSSAPLRCSHWYLSARMHKPQLNNAIPIFGFLITLIYIATLLQLYHHTFLFLLRNRFFNFIQASGEFLRRMEVMK